MIRSNLVSLYEREMQIFRQRIPRSLALHERGKSVMPNGVPTTWMVGLYDHPPIFIRGGQGAWLEDVDGNRYLDMNHADMSMSCGYGHPVIANAVSAQIAQGSQFLLPTELAIEVSELLGQRFGLPKWQYTLSASIANKECIKIARAHTGRRRILVFEGSYHGHIADTLNARNVSPAETELADAVSIPFNDLSMLEQMLTTGEFALVLLEPAMTNISLVKPQQGYLQSMRDLCSKHGTLLLADETHTHVCAWGGLTREWVIDPDFLVVGKAIAGGIPMGVYGMRDEIAECVTANTDFDHWPEPGAGGMALGGTLFGYPLALAASKAVLSEILTPEAHQFTARLGKQLADGLDALVAEHGFPWCAFRLYCRTGICYGNAVPANAEEATQMANFQLNRYQRLFMANRGIWEAILSAGPAISFVMTKQDVNRYLDVFEEMLKSLD